MRHSRILILALFLAISAFGIRFLRENSGQFLRFEAESGQVRANFWIVDDSTASGGRYACAMRRQMSKDEVASMDFHVTVRRGGSYFLWARVYWPNSCANSLIFTLLQNNQPFFTTFAGNDAVFERWHWVKSQAPVRLDTGDYVLQLSIAEWYGVVDVIVLSSDESFRPDAGSADRKRSSPVSIKSEWVAEGGTRLERGGDLVLSGSANPTILHPNRTFGEGLYISARLRAGDPAPESVRLLFDVGEEGSARVVELGGGRCRLVSRRDAGVQVLCEAPAATDWSDGESHLVVLQRAYGRVLMWADGALALAVSAPLEHPGKIGLGASDGVLHVEEVMCVEREPIELASNFDINISPLGVAHGWTPVSGLWERSEWREYPEAYMVWGTGPLLATAGSESWGDYFMTCALSVSEGSEGGLVLRSLGEDSRIEVIARPRSSEVPARLSLIEKTEGGAEILGEAGVDLHPDEWCLLDAQVRGSEARVWFNGVETLKCNVSATRGQVGLMALRETPCPARSPLRPLYFLDAGEVRQLEIPLKVTSAATEMGVYFDRSPQKVELVRVEYSDPERALFQALRVQRGSMTVLSSRVFDLRSFIRCPVGDPPPQLPVSFLIEGGREGLKARIVSGPNEVALPYMQMEIDPTAEVGIYDRTPEPAARFDDVLVTGLPYDVVRADRDTLLFSFNTNYQDGREMASWRPIRGVWTMAPRSILNLVGTECLVGLVRQADAAIELREPVHSEGITVSTDIYLPGHLDGSAALEITDSGGQAVRLYLGPDSRVGHGRRYGLRDDSGIVSEGTLQGGDVWSRLALGVGPAGVIAAVDGKQVASERLIRAQGPFRVSLHVEGHQGARAHFDDIRIVRI